MAKEVVTNLIDDLVKAQTGERVVANQQIRFSIGDTRYEIDLTDDNAAEFFRVMKPYMAAATEVAVRKVSPPKTSVPRAATTPKSSNSGTSKQRTDRDRTEAIRVWARQNNFSVSDRGRIASNVVTAYEEAGSPTLAALQGATLAPVDNFTPVASQDYSYAG